MKSANSKGDRPDYAVRIASTVLDFLEMQIILCHRNVAARKHTVGVRIMSSNNGIKIKADLINATKFYRDAVPHDASEAVEMMGVVYLKFREYFTSSEQDQGIHIIQRSDVELPKPGELASKCI